MGNPWTELVQKTFAENKHKSGYKFKNALLDAKKVYRKSTSNANTMGPKMVKKTAKTVIDTISNTLAPEHNKSRRTRRRKNGGTRHQRV